MWEIKPERPEDAPLIEALTAQSFGPGRIVKAAWRLREGVDPEAGLSFVAVEDGILRGSVRFWPVAVGPPGLSFWVRWPYRPTSAAAASASI